MPEPHEEVHVRAAASVVVQALIASTAFAFAVLELNAAEQIQHRALQASGVRQVGLAASLRPFDQHGLMSFALPANG